MDNEDNEVSLHTMKGLSNSPLLSKEEIEASYA